ncbi:hypothetical protein F4810DRAFT_169218 [Camillea tinctor]|nr:hypothetical protein F4810DRAFT_169218 [Camillea tinctor]
MEEEWGEKKKKNKRIKKKVVSTLICIVWYVIVSGECGWGLFVLGSLIEIDFFHLPINYMGTYMSTYTSYIAYLTCDFLLFFLPPLFCDFLSRTNNGQKEK